MSWRIYSTHMRTTQRVSREAPSHDRTLNPFRFTDLSPVFGRVSMLYINAEVNGHPIKAFVDSGAQVTIMSPSCAEACGIMRLIDTRYSGIAKGVGTARIIGRVHHAEITIGGASMACAFTVMEGKDVDLLFGLDMLKRYKAKIDLEKNALCFQGIEVPFLGEAEIPKQHEEAMLQEPTVAGPNGTEIGTESGAIQPAGTAAGVGSATSSQSNFRGQGQTLGSASGSTTSSRPSGRAQPSQADVPSFPQKDIDQLVSLGFSKDEAIRALQATGGDVELAAGLLFG
jgi:DNA damage-inducible protein 1